MKDSDFERWLRERMIDNIKIYSVAVFYANTNIGIFKIILN